MGEQIIYICLNAGVPGDLSDIDVDEQEVTQPSEPDEKERTPQQLRHSEIIQKPNPEYANEVIIQDKVKELETYGETSPNTAWQQTMEDKIIALEKNQNWELVPRSGEVKSSFAS